MLDDWLLLYLDLDPTCIKIKKLYVQANVRGGGTDTACVEGFHTCRSTVLFSAEH